MRPLVYRMAARAKAAATPTMVRRALAWRSLAGDHPLVGVPPFGRVLVVAPHPDDESLACGGTVAALTAAGAAVTVLVATDGSATIGATADASSVAAARRDEAARAAAVLGVTDVRAVGLPDGDLASHLDELADAITTAAAAGPPLDAVLTTWFGEDHPDHRAITGGLARATLPTAVEVWGGEVWTPVPANRTVPLDAAAWQAKVDAVACHATAMGAFDVTAMLGINRYRSVHGIAGDGHAEAFLAAPLDGWLELAATDPRVADLLP